MMLTNLEDWKNIIEEESVSGALPEGARWINGRIIAVLASPELNNATSYATGVSVLPPGTATPWHSHEAEELAFIVKGAGVIAIGDNIIEVSQGDVVRTASAEKHQTIAAESSELVVFWVYAPAGSENRWFDESPKE